MKWFRWKRRDVLGEQIAASIAETLRLAAELDASREIQRANDAVSAFRDDMRRDPGGELTP